MVMPENNSFISKIPFIGHWAKDSHMEEILSGTVKAMYLRLLGALFIFLLNILLARLLGADGIGIYFLALSVVMLAHTIGCLGIGLAVVRFIAEAVSNRDTARVRIIAGISIKTVALSSGLISVVVFILAHWIAVDVLGRVELVWPLRAMSLVITPISLSIIYSELLRGLKRISYSHFLRMLALPMFALPLCYFLAQSFGLKGAVIAYLIAALLTFLASFVLWRVSIRKSIAKVSDSMKAESSSFTLNRLLTTSTPLLWVTTLSLFMGWGSTFFIALWNSNLEVGTYTMAARMAMPIGMILTSIASISMPKFAEIHSTSDIKTLARTGRRASKLAVILSLPLLFILIIFSTELMSIFGSEFKVAGGVLIVLTIGQFVAVVTAATGQALMVTGHECLARNSSLISALLFLILNLVLIPKYGIMGAAIATTLGLIARSILTWIFLYRAMGINLLPFGSPVRESRNDGDSLR
jgi:O-antigen/teichoic acid export membrane protein